MAIALIVADLSLSTSNRALQADVSQRQATIAEGQSLSQLNQELVQTMAEAVVKNNNLELRDLLSAQGITLKSESAAAPAPAQKPVVKK